LQFFVVSCNKNYYIAETLIRSFTMNPKDFKQSSAGKCFKTPQRYWAFTPAALPPPIDFTVDLIHQLSEANRLLGELSGTGKLLPNPYLLISPYIRREAVSSSRIEGTLTSLSDLFFFESAESEKPRVPDVIEVRNYVKAMEYGLQRLAKLPVSTRLVREIHKVLMENVRGGNATPGELRKSQNWIGPPGCILNNATYVPPPVNEMKKSLSDWEKFIHSKQDIPILIQCALMHYQFEAIHPFLDGNGRIGRLLITFFLCERKYLTQPLLYVSAFFDRFRKEYYSRLLAVSQRGEWNQWIQFFLNGVITQSTEAISDAEVILSLHAEYRRLIEESKKVPESAYRLCEEIFLNPVVSISTLSKKWQIPFNSVKTGVNRLIKLGILREEADRKRNKLFVASKLMELLTGPTK